MNEALWKRRPLADSRKSCWIRSRSWSTKTPFCSDRWPRQGGPSFAKGRGRRPRPCRPPLNSRAGEARKKRTSATGWPTPTTARGRPIQATCFAQGPPPTEKTTVGPTTDLVASTFCWADHDYLFFFRPKPPHHHPWAGCVTALLGRSGIAGTLSASTITICDRLVLKLNGKGRSNRCT